MLTINEIVGMEVIKKARTELKEYEFIPAVKDYFIFRPEGASEIKIYLDEKLEDNLDIIKFGVSDKHKIVAFKMTDKYGWFY